MSEKSYVLCWRIINNGDDCDDPVLFEATHGLALKVVAALGPLSRTLATDVLRRWGEGRSVRTRMSVYDPVPQAQVPRWLDALEDA